MDLQQPQTPSTIQTTVNQELSYKRLMQEISENLERDDKKKEENRNQLKQLLLAFNDKLDDASNPILINVTALKNIENLQITTRNQSLSIEQLQEQNKQLVEKIKKLSQNSGSSDSATIILQCVGFIGLIALTITAMIIQANNGCA